MLHATSAEGIPPTPHFLKGEIVDTVLRTYQTLLKARKHAFFLKKAGGLDPDFFAFDSCLGDLSADRDVEFSLLIVS